MYGQPLRSRNERSAIRLLTQATDPEQVLHYEHETTGESLLHLAARKCWLNVVKLLTTRYHLSPNCEDKLGVTALDRAKRVKDEVEEEVSSLREQIERVEKLGKSHVLDMPRAQQKMETAREIVSYLEDLLGTCCTLCSFVCQWCMVMHMHLNIFIN